MVIASSGATSAKPPPSRPLSRAFTHSIETGNKEADEFINGTTGEELSADAVAVTKDAKYYVYEAKGGDISHGLEQLEHTSRQLGSGSVQRQTLVVKEKITTPGYSTEDGVLMFDGKRVIVDGKPVYVKYSTQVRR